MRDGGAWSKPSLKVYAETPGRPVVKTPHFQGRGQVFPRFPVGDQRSHKMCGVAKKQKSVGIT